MNLKWTAEKSVALSRILTAVMLALGAAAVICIPICTEWYDAVSGMAPISPVLNTALYLSDALFLTAMWALHVMLGNLAKQALFVTKNVTCMRVISWCCFAVSVIWLALSFWRLLAFFVAFVAAFAGLILRVMKNLFAKAVELREENDYTI